ncbi:flavin monoamine oxidase family protein [Xinfangfangia sp. CPCC 101601]|uniref:Tryptophan 2-monooxygenase n=1 Tax=Pseudogemmobacter lacusdianii TaxID=3069608 RepID=A0ABU0VUT0_9RHOB|nr:flavin monoamine oxidase family protein [Xinfangfangia sp. CPCC 101601]MDQ2065481.1 flavin monoamine oxidase family protein [Xinfangfangia sp. CPCC 101601]
MVDHISGMTRRGVLTMIGLAAGASAMYTAMAGMGLAGTSNYKGPIKLEGDPKGTSVLILGAGLAGLTAALELHNAGYKVQVLEYREKAGGRCWTLRGGETYTELGGFKQEVKFTEGNYLNAGPWRIPSDHYAVLDYCRRFGVKLEPFIQQNYNAYLHNSQAFGGKPQRFKEIQADYRGQISELLAKAVDQKKLDGPLTDDDAALLVESLKRYGVLDENLAYVKSDATSIYRGWAKEPGGGVDAKGEPSDIISLSDILQGRLWQDLITGESIDHQAGIFQPVGGMDMIAQGFEREVKDLITYNAKVIKIEGSETGVSATYVDSNGGTAEKTVSADYCICTIPFSVLSQIEHNFSGEMTEAIDSVPYASSIKVGLEFKRRFWEEDEHIYGGISYTDTPITLISYPSNDYLSKGPGVLLGAYSWGAASYQFNAIPAEERIEIALKYGEMIHKQYRDEYSNGVTVAWHRVPWTLGCYGEWRDQEAHYDNACKMDQRTLMAGEHISYLPAWQEGAILSALNAIERLHKIVTAA